VYDDIVFTVKNTEGEMVNIVIKVEDYVLEVLDEHGQIDHCTVLLDYIEDSFFYDPAQGYGLLLGDSFIRSYYMIHDNEWVDGRGRLGFGHRE